MKPPMKQITNIGMMNPLLSTISSWFNLCITVLMNTTVSTPASNPSKRHAPAFSMYPAPAPIIIAPTMQPKDAYFAPTIPLLKSMDVE